MGQQDAPDRPTATEETPGFLGGGGTCGELIARRDWQGTPLGPARNWPRSLQTAVGIMLRSPNPTLLLWGVEGIVLHNDAFALITAGLNPEIIGSRALDRWPDSAGFLFEVLERSLAGETLTFRNQEFTSHRHGHAERIFLNIDCVPVPGEDGNPAGILMTIVETTEAVLAPQPRSQTEPPRQEELQRLDMIGQITGGFAHDFNNLLTPIVAGLDIIRRKLPDERSQRLISGALQSSERAATLVQRLLAFAGRQMLQPSAISPSGLLEGLRDLIDRSLGPSVELRLEVPPDLPPIMVDPSQLEVSLLNLSANARDAMPTGGRVTLTAELVDTDDDPVPGLPPGLYVSIAMADNGVGMDTATANRAVEPFFSTKPAGQGTGLGLSMVHGFAAQSGGAFKLLTEKGRGTAAVLFLPVAQEIANEGESGEAAMVARKTVVLLVDDEDLVRMSMAEGLRELGYDVEDVGTAAEALEAVRMGFVPDVLVTDHIMPGMLGADLARELRERLPDLPVLMITGYAQLSPEQTRGLQVLGKPFRQSDLASRLALMLAVESDKVVPLRPRGPGASAASK
ncbi:PAS domain-containing hybrid sensor histidine kinase/response regulator [Rubellimicrobium arenae]|uniref:PAS domain-containing hybrid sensor histidine kinase/response regulator n=1 Tax=Rubellimicrobium arenae TaxID=2817372 RepID=UPI001B3070EE|nr:response regulator [Rubellimicrobium arenae]